MKPNRTDPRLLKNIGATSPPREAVVRQASLFVERQCGADSGAKYQYTATNMQHGGLTSSEWPQKVASRLFTGYADARLRAVGANDSIRMQLRPSALMSASRIVTMHVMPFCDPTWCHLSHA